jgi:hypothetical protein
MLRLRSLQIGTNCTSQRRKIGLASQLQQERATRDSGLHGARAAGSCVRENARLNKREDGARKKRNVGIGRIRIMHSSTAHFCFSPSKIFLVAALSIALPITPASALNLATPASAIIKAGDQASSDLIEVRAVARHGGAAVGRHGAVVSRGGAAVGPRGNVAVRSTAVVAGRGGWARPSTYRWPRGGAIAAGAAIGFVSAATAVAWAGAAPAPGMCWYYTDPTRTQGFWDYCQ